MVAMKNGKKVEDIEEENAREAGASCRQGTLS